jgi:tetratricopeptide (TPR) repeat protein
VRAQRRALHQAIAEWYEQHHAAQLAGFYPLLAHHWSRTDVAAKAIQFQGLAGEQALAGGAYHEAVLFLTAALERDPPLPKDGSGEGRFRRARWERQLAEAHLGFGSTGEGRIHLGRALELLGTPLPATPRQLIGSVLGQLALQAVHRLFPIQAVGRGRRSSEESLEASRAYMRLTEVFWFANDVPALIHASLQALNQAERAGPSPELARAYSIMCLAAGSAPIHPLARAYALRAEQTARRAGQLWPLGYVRFITCVYKIGAGRWAELDEALAEAEALLEQAGDRRALGDALTVQAMSSLYRGQFQPAAAGFDDVFRRGRRDDNVQHQVWGLLGKAECELRVGRLGQAAGLLEAALALLIDHPDQAERLRAYGLLAWRGCARAKPRPPSRPPRRPPASSPGSGHRRLTTCLRGTRASPRSTCRCGRPARIPATPAERPGRPAESCEASPASSRSASREPGSGKGALPICPDGPSGHRRLGGRVWPPPNGSGCRSRPPWHMPSWAGMQLAPPRDIGILSRPRRCCASWNYRRANPPPQQRCMVRHPPARHHRLERRRRRTSTPITERISPTVRHAIYSEPGPHRRPGVGEPTEPIKSSAWLRHQSRGEHVLAAKVVMIQGRL